MRRMPRGVAEALYRSRRGIVLAQGAVLAMAAYIPILNLLIPVIGTAAMVHILDDAISSGRATGEELGGPPYRMFRQSTDTHRRGYQR